MNKREIITNRTRYIVPFIVVSILFFSVVGFSGIEEDYWPTQGWRVSTPEEQGVDSRTLAEAVNRVMDENLNIHSSNKGKASRRRWLWLFVVDFGDNSYSALGRGEQCVYVLPEKNLIIVMTGGGLLMSTLQFLDNYILPAVHNKQSLPAGPEGASQLKDAVRRVAQEKKMETESVHPIPEIAQKISGKKFIVESNTLEVLGFTLTFIDEREAKIQLELALDSDRAPEYLLGLDGVSRISQGRFGIPASGTAVWDSDDTFKIHINEIGNINRFDFVIVFDKETAEFSLIEKTGLGEFSARARLRD